MGGGVWKQECRPSRKFTSQKRTGDRGRGGHRGKGFQPAYLGSDRIKKSSGETGRGSVVVRLEWPHGGN